MRERRPWTAEGVTYASSSWGARAAEDTAVARPISNSSVFQHVPAPIMCLVPMEASNVVRWTARVGTLTVRW
jgi:hypothetical protein